MHVNISPPDDTVTGDQSVVFTPDLPVDHLVFRLWPNGPRTAPFGADLQVADVKVDGAPAVPTRANPTTIVVPLGHSAAARHAMHVSMTWRLHLARPVDDRVAHAGDGIRLGSFFPILPWEPGVGWAMDPPTTAYAESSTAPAADIDFAVAVPPGYTVLASGAADPARPGHFVATGMRDIAISVGHFRIATGVALGPQPVPVTVGVAADVDESPQPYVDKIVRVIAAHSARFGAYPWPAFTMAVTAALHGGIEYPGHVMQGPGTLGRTTSHELGHQWFYALVGNDQGRDPWLDEGLASWAEARAENTLASFVSRAIPADARGHVADPMTFWDSHRSSYYDGVYVQGVQALAAVASPDIVDCALARYVAVDAYRIARPRDLVDALEVAAPGAAARMARFGVRG
ncbi:MAG: hypothetical protein JWO37_2676 [Acidimicrobiales bacterium]|jgi:hypothetical protein|nr:hypothetical protein [Acidimicrobiales bacterium]